MLRLRGWISKTIFKCDSPVIELSIPNRDDTLEWDESSERFEPEAGEGLVAFSVYHALKYSVQCVLG